MNQSPLALLFFFFFTSRSVCAHQLHSVSHAHSAVVSKLTVDERSLTSPIQIIRLQNIQRHFVSEGPPPTHPPIHPPTPSLEVSLLSFAVYFSSNLCEVHDNEHSFCFPPVSPLPVIVHTRTWERLRRLGHRQHTGTSRLATRAQFKNPTLLNNYKQTQEEETVTKGDQYS